MGFVTWDFLNQAEDTCKGSREQMTSRHQDFSLPSDASSSGQSIESRSKFALLSADVQAVMVVGIMPANNLASGGSARIIDQMLEVLHELFQLLQ